MIIPHSIDELLVYPTLMNYLVLGCILAIPAIPKLLTSSFLSLNFVANTRSFELAFVQLAPLGLHLLQQIHDQNHFLPC
jgi:hypothetical protein